MTSLTFPPRPQYQSTERVTDRNRKHKHCFLSCWLQIMHPSMKEGEDFQNSDLSVIRLYHRIRLERTRSSEVRSFYNDFFSITTCRRNVSQYKILLLTSYPAMLKEWKTRAVSYVSPLRVTCIGLARSPRAQLRNSQKHVLRFNYAIHNGVLTDW